MIMSFVLQKALLSLLFYTDNLYFFTTFLSLLFPYFSVDVHLKACLTMNSLKLATIGSRKHFKLCSFFKKQILFKGGY